MGLREPHTGSSLTIRQRGLCAGRRQDLKALVTGTHLPLGLSSFQMQSGEERPADGHTILATRDDLSSTRFNLSSD